MTGAGAGLGRVWADGVGRGRGLGVGVVSVRNISALLDGSVMFTLPDRCARSVPGIGKDQGIPKVNRVVWTKFRPGSGALHDDASRVPLRERETLACPNACPACTCAGAPDLIGD